MDTGPRFGDELQTQCFEPGTKDYYLIEANNAEYRSRHSGQNKNYDNPLLTQVVNSWRGKNLFKQF